MVADQLIEVRYKYRLRVSLPRQERFQVVFDNSRFVWNHMLGRWSDLWRYEQVSLGPTVMHRELTDLRSRFAWLAGSPQVPQQQTINDLGKAITAFFDKTNRAGRPRMKKKGTMCSSRWSKNGFHVTGTGTGRKGDRLSIALPGGRAEIPVVWSRPLPSEPTSATVTRDPEGHWWVSFVVRIPTETVVLPDPTTGIDVGLKVLATASTATGDVPNPRFSKAEQKLLRRVDARVGRGRRDERLSEKSRLRRARAHGKVARRRLDHHRKTARQVARSYSEIGIEDLRIKNLLANHALARHISDSGWGLWVAQLDHQRRKIGAPPPIRMNPRNTTQNCSRCGTKAKIHLTLADRVFKCETCGHEADRDRNAAHNLDPGRTPDPALAARATTQQHEEQLPAKTGVGGVTTAEDLPAPAGTTGNPNARIPRL